MAFQWKNYTFAYSSPDSDIVISSVRGCVQSGEESGEDREEMLLVLKESRCRQLAIVAAKVTGGLVEAGVWPLCWL